MKVESKVPLVPAIIRDAASGIVSQMWTLAVGGGVQSSGLVGFGIFPLIVTLCELITQ